VPEKRRLELIYFPKWIMRAKNTSSLFPQINLTPLINSGIRISLNPFQRKYKNSLKII